jgi:valyl-tRNA synthetase
MMGLHFMGEVPFKHVVIHGLVRDEKGAKMSKSKGNVLDPLELIDANGADAVRFTLCALASPGRDIKLSKQRMEGYRAFATKLWNAARFCEMNGIAAQPGWDPATAATPLARWILDGANTAAAEAGTALDAFRFDDYAAALYRFTWNSFCDWFLEFAKPVLNGPDGAEKDEVKGAAQHVLGVILRLMHPVMPFVTEELWTQLGYGGEASLIKATWPEAMPVQDAEAARAEFGSLTELIGEIRTTRAEMNLPMGKMLDFWRGTRAAVDEAVAPFPLFVRHQTVIERLGRVNVIGDKPYGRREPAVADASRAIQIVACNSTFFLDVGSEFDLGAERARLTKARMAAQGEITKIERKFGNAEFMAKAKEEVIEENRDRLENFTAEIARLDAALGRIAG